MQIEKIGIINMRGLDYDENDMIESTFVIFQFSPEKQPITKVRSGRGHTLKQSLEDAELQSSFSLTAGKTKVELFGKEIAEQGIFPYLDTIARDAQVADMMYLAIGTPNAREIVTVDETMLSTDVGQFIYHLLKEITTDHNIPRKTVQDFFRIYFDVGQDNVLPIVTIEAGVPKFESIGILKDDKLVGEITTDQAIFINLVVRTVKNQQLELSFPTEPFKGHIAKDDPNSENEVVYAAFNIAKGKSKTTVIDSENLMFETDVSVNVHLLEQSVGILYDHPHVVQIMERQIEKKMTKHFEELLAQLQELNADSFGYGRFYRMHQKDGKLTKEEWSEKYPNIDVEFNVDVTLSRYGIVE